MRRSLYAAGLVALLLPLSGCEVFIDPGAIAYGAARVAAGGASIRLTADGRVTATVDAWSRFSVATGGMLLLSRQATDILGLMLSILREGVPPGTPVDLVFVIDTTGSME